MIALRLISCRPPLRWLTHVIACCALVGPAVATEYFVGPDGSDDAQGTSPQASLKTIQKAVGRLQSGDTLTLLPGEYMQRFAVRQNASADRPITIRAAIPGFSVIRGDIPVVKFEKVAGTRFVWASRSERWVYRVFELDTRAVYLEAPDLRDMDQFRPSYLYDRQGKTLYVHTSDGQAPSQHALSASETPGYGAEIAGQHIRVEGLVVRGFAATSIRETGHGFGMSLAGEGNEIRHCSFLYNGGGVVIRAKNCVLADNLLIANLTPGPSLAQVYCTGASEDIRITNNRVLDARMYGIRNYSEPKDSIATGNIVRNAYIGLDFKASVGRRGATHNVVVDCPYLNWNTGGNREGLTEDFNVLQVQSVWGTDANPQNAGRHTLVFDPAKQDPKFADPDHLDYRLQADSPFRGKGPDGSDLGAYPFESNVFYVSPTGGDSNDGLSVAGAFRTIGRAMKEARPGVTIYLVEGGYDEIIQPAASGASDSMIVIRGRGKRSAVRVAGINLSHVQHVQVENLQVAGGASVDGSAEVRLDRCAFQGSGAAGIAVTDTDDLWLRRVTVWNAVGPAVQVKGRTRDLKITSSILHSKTAPAVVSDRGADGLFCEYNDYLPAAGQPAAVIGGQTYAAAGSLQAVTGGDRYSLSAEPQLMSPADSAAIAPTSPCAGTGEMTEPIGAGEVTPAKLEPAVTEIKLRDVTPNSASLTWWTPNMTADMWRRPLEWWMSYPIYSEVRYGTSPECGQKVHSFGHLYHRVTLHDLAPDTTYYFKVVLHDRLWEDSIYREYGPGYDRGRWAGWESGPLAFKTPAAAAWQPTRRSFHVSPDGSSENSGLEEDLPTTLTAASDRVRAGDTVVLLDGIYREMFAPAASGAPDAPITLRAKNPAKACLDGCEFVRPSGVALYWKKHIIVDGVVMRRFSDGGNGRRAGLTNCQVFMARSGDVTLRNCVLAGWSVDSCELALLARGGGPLTITNCVITGFMHAVCTRNINRVSLIGNTWYVPLIDDFDVWSEEAGEAMVKNNLFFGQETQKVFHYSAMVSDHKPAESDYNAFYFGPRNPARYIGYGIKHKEEQDMGGVGRVQKELALDLHSFEPSPEDVRLRGPAPTDYLDDQALSVFTHAVRDGQLIPTLEMFDLPPDSRLNRAGQGGGPIGARPITRR